MYIKLTTIKNVKDFNELANKFDGDILIKYGRYVIDGKSIMGLFSLNLLETLEVQLISDSIKSEIEFCNQVRNLGILVEQVSNY